MNRLLIHVFSYLALGTFSCIAYGGEIAYIHGDVSECGTTPAADEEDPDCSNQPYDQMLLSDSGNTGLSEFRSLVIAQNHTIASFYDQQTLLTDQWFESKDVVIFGLHQKIWSAQEKAALQRWLNAGGGMFIYSDSASGGCFCEIGAQNPVGQSVTNNLIAEYGMQVTVDQADGTTGHSAAGPTSIAGIDSSKTLEGEGVSPVAREAGDTNIEILIPYDRAVSKRQNLQFSNPEFAALAMAPVGMGHIVVMFDRQPMWNNGPGSDIDEENNRQILRDVINFLAVRPAVPNPSPTPQPTDGSVLSSIYLLLDDE